MQFAFQPLLAAADWLQLAIFLVVGFFAIMKKLFDAANTPSKNRPGVPAGSQQPRPPATKPAAAGQQADPLRSQVEEFLRRAGQPVQAASPLPPAQTQPAREIEIFGTERAQFSERKAAAPKRLGQRVATPRTAPPSDSVKRKPMRRQTVAEHVADRVASRSQSLGDKASQLGQRIVNDDQQFDSQLKAKFDHTVGTLAGTSATTTDQPAAPVVDTPARQIATLLANADGVRQAVIVNEILRRPSERW